MQTSRERVVMHPYNPSTRDAGTEDPWALLANLFYVLDEFQAHKKSCLTNQGRWFLRKHTWGYSPVSKWESSQKHACLCPSSTHTQKIAERPFRMYLDSAPPGSIAAPEESGEAHSTLVIWMEQPGSCDPLLVGGGWVNVLLLHPDPALNSLCGSHWRVHL